MKENLNKGDYTMKENLIKCTVRTEKNGLIVECELSHKTINELKTINLVSVRKIQK